MILAAHQPDLLPYSGFWHKMAKADVFDLAVHDQFQSRGFQRRVRMRQSWASLPLMGKPHLLPITKVVLAPEAPKTLKRVIVGRYGGSRFWSRRGPDLLALIDAAPRDLLVEFNTSLIIGVQQMLGIRTPVAIVAPPKGSGNDGIIDVCRKHGCGTYLSGPGGAAYMGDQHEFEGTGIRVIWSKHQAVTGDSIVSVLMDHPDPLAVVMKERP